ncbi:class I SAM-dependent methyltransferase [Nocardioides nanhaiensis]|uniref:Class I SAM-dependent methyltransferase n=1 Tax=Nocardioides nanhaiensis TaxID=1476871 RepID=A0ABP8W8X5_9ACTN
MRRHDLLAGLHQRLRPRTYLELGVSTGSSMSLSRARSIGVDPAFTVKREVRCDLQLVRSTSDEFFARPDPLAHFEGVPVDLAFVDGMHLAEYALRDVVNVARHAHPATVVVLDDMLPRNHDEASRDRRRGHGAWAGDVFKVLDVLRSTAPDLTVIEVDTAPTGVAVVLGLAAAHEALLAAYDDVLPALLGPDPQQVPARVLERSDARDPAGLLESGLWGELAALREAGPGLEPGAVRDALRRHLGG